MIVTKRFLGTWNLNMPPFLEFLYHSFMFTWKLDLSKKSCWHLENKKYYKMYTNICLGSSLKVYLSCSQYFSIERLQLENCLNLVLKILCTPSSIQHFINRCFKTDYTFFWDRVSLCSTCWPQTYNLLTLTSPVLGLQVWATTLSLTRLVTHKLNMPFSPEHPQVQNLSLPGSFSLPRLSTSLGLKAFWVLSKTVSDVLTEGNFKNQDLPEAMEK
jgi:hypothetical protein